MPKKKEVSSDDAKSKSRIEKLIDLYNEKSKNAGDLIIVGDDSIKRDIPVVSTGILSLDVALGVGGFPQGRIVETFGPEMSGKTTVALQTISEAQKLGGIAAYVDAEHALDINYAASLGVDCNNLLINQPNCGEEALESVSTLVNVLGFGDIIVVDSVAALTPRAEIDGEMGAAHMGLQARLMSQAMRKITGNISNSGVIVIFINQIRQKIGVMFGSPDTTTGGNALKFYASVRLDVRSSTAIKKADQKIGCESKIKVVKNKVAPPFREAKVPMIYGRGFLRDLDIINLAIENGLVEKSGASYTLTNEEKTKIAYGKDNLQNLSETNPKILDKLEKQLRKIYFGE